ncbi:hypothetical protein NE865_12995 [Phthorimaea operculella]|nr:hypothetical protein NE865_12995 [Phthorimaea operculella]
MAYDGLSYAKIKQLDIESAKNMIEGKGPADECICRILSPPEDRTGKGIGGMKDSIKRAFRTMSGSVRRKSIGEEGRRSAKGSKRGSLCVNPSCQGNTLGRGGGVYIPLTSTKGGKGIFTTKEPLKRQKPCSGKCGCEKKDFVMKHSYANIQITSPDVSSICPCPNSCLSTDWENFVMKHSYANIRIISPDVSSVCPCPSNCLNTEALSNIKVTVERLEVPPKQPAGTVPSEAPTLPKPVIRKQSITELIAGQYKNNVTIEEDQKSFQEDDSQFFEE